MVSVLSRLDSKLVNLIYFASLLPPGLVVVDFVIQRCNQVTLLLFTDFWLQGKDLVFLIEVYLFISYDLTFHNSHVNIFLKHVHWLQRL